MKVGFSMDVEQEIKKKINKVLEERQLYSVMNNTKWGQLRAAVITTLPFVPPIQIKYVLEDTPNPECFDQDVSYLSDWMDGVPPFVIEWIRVRPRYLKLRGHLVSPEIIDCTEEFLVILQKIKIPYIKADNSFYIYGYIHDTGSLVKEN
jgi:hypothetical protein